MKIKQFAHVALATALLTSLGSVLAAPISLSSYDMLNGNTGSYTYWDDSYSGSGSTTTNNSSLTGGKGDLTDGVKAIQNWYITPGTYVGWTLNPTITFHFGGPVSINKISFNFDDANGYGGVSAPASVVIDGTTVIISDPAGSDPFQFDVIGLNLNVSDLNIQINASNAWVFVSEISFEGTGSGGYVPEPASLALLSLGLAGIVASRRRKTV